MTLITWSKKLYIGPSIKRRHRYIKYAISHGKSKIGIYCITFASNQENLFDILPANELLFPHYKNSRIHILGLACGKIEALLLVRNMIDELYHETGNFKVREYFD